MNLINSGYSCLYLEDHFNTDVPNSFFRPVLNSYNN